MKHSLILSTVLFAACGDDNKATPDAAVTEDSASDDAPIDATSYVWPTPFAIAISAAGPDQLMSVAPGPSGTFYAAGYAAATASGAKFLIVAKLTAAGALDTTFASPNGFYTSALEFQGGGDEIDIAVQSTGNIVVSGTIANANNPVDRDIGLFRVDASGALDTDFGTAGMSVIDLSTAYDSGTALSALDSARALAVGPSDTLFLHAVSRDEVDTASGGGPRIDSDFTIAKLTIDGDLDTNWATGGKFLLDILESNATTKGMHVLADGSVIGSGYANSSAFNKVQPVLYRVTAAGILDVNFADQGLFHEIVLADQTEIYSFSVDGDRLTTAGYGHQNLGETNQWVSLRFNTTTGVRSTTFGNASGGAVLIDPSGTLAGNNCRNAIGLSGGKTALIGSAGAGGARDAALAILTQNGQLDTSFGSGVHTFSLDGTEDQWWGGAVSGAKLLVTGWKGVGTTQTDSVNDNSYGVLLDL